MLDLFIHSLKFLTIYFTCKNKGFEGVKVPTRNEIRPQCPSLLLSSPTRTLTITTTLVKLEILLVFHKKGLFNDNHMALTARASSGFRFNGGKL